MSRPERPPAYAYFQVAEILGDEYFAKHPPRAGRRIEVTGLDGLTTTWECTYGQAEQLMGAIQGRRDLFAVSRPFDRGSDPKPETP